jgi:hypothetical protein
MAGFEFHRLPIDDGEEVVGPFKVLLGAVVSVLQSINQFFTLKIPVLAEKRVIL